MALETTLDGLNDIARYQAHTNGETTFLTGALDASYDDVWQAEIDGSAVTQKTTTELKHVHR